MWLAAHHGVMSRQEGLRLGLSRYQIEARLRSGEWLRVVPGVYRLGGAPFDNLARLRAAVLAAGEGAVASHWSAAWLLGIHPELESLTVTTPHGRHRAEVDDVRIVRSRLPFRSLVRHGIPCTAAVRTLVDCAGGASPAEIDDLLDRALARRTVRLEEVVETMRGATYRHHVGRSALAERLAQRGVTGSPAPSVLESRMARLFVAHGLPVPKAEVTWGPQRRYRLDFAYPLLRLAIEVDGWAAHFSPERQRWDNRRSNALAGAGWTVLRYNWWEVTYESERVAAEISATYQLLAA